MMLRILSPIGTKKRLCRRNSLSTTQSPLFALFVCFQKFFLCVFFPFFKTLLCDLLLCVYIRVKVCGRLYKNEIRQNHQKRNHIHAFAESFVDAALFCFLTLVDLLRGKIVVLWVLEIESHLLDVVVAFHNLYFFLMLNIVCFNLTLQRYFKVWAVILHTI